jgi:hypothetical protein
MIKLSVSQQDLARLGPKSLVRLTSNQRTFTWPAQRYRLTPTGSFALKGSEARLLLSASGKLSSGHAVQQSRREAAVFCATLSVLFG